LGAHTNEVLKDILGLSDQEIANLNENGITSLNNKEK
jgi:crotonobetainyl-CoA:carnitine CoA-transferase CaiB-like acyl-CoA transferase